MTGARRPAALRDVDEARVPGAAGGLAEGCGLDFAGSHAASLLSAAGQGAAGEQRQGLPARHEL